MELLGHLGIDIKLLIAQVINFGLLLWLLKIFLYGPMVKRIEKDEKEFEKAQTETKKLKQERAVFAEQKKRELSQARATAEQIIAEAEEIANKIKQQTKNDVKMEAQSFMKMTKRDLSLRKSALRHDLIDDIKQEVNINAGKLIPELLPAKTQKILENTFFDHLIRRLLSANIKKQQGAPEEFVSAKLGPTIIWSVHGLSKKQEEKLAEAVAKKTGTLLPIAKREDESMIVGFRLEVANLLIESNLWEIISYGFKQVKNK